MLDLANDSRFAATAQLYLKYLALIPAAVVVAALYFGRPVLLPVAIAVLLAFAIAPFCTGLRRIGLGRMWSVFIASFISIAFIVGIGVFVVTKTVQLADQLPLYQNNLVQKIQSIRGTADETSMLGRAAAMLKMLREQVVGGSTTISATSPPPPGAAQSPNTGTVAVEIKQPDIAPLEIAASFMARLFSFLMAAGIIIVFVVFILLYKEDIRDRFIRLAGSRDLQRTTLLLDEGAERLGRYLLTQTAINAAFGLLIGVGLWFIGLPNPELWGITVMIFRFVPYIGVPLAAIFPVVLALAVDPGWSMAISSFALFFVGEFLFGQAVEPVCYGRGLGLSPAAVIISATFWTWLWGPVGLLLSTPLTLCLVVLGHHVPHLQFLDVLFGDQPALSAEETLYIRILGDDADEAAAEAESFIKENSLAHYYNEVVLKALLIAQADINRGALDSERVTKIRETTRALIENLSDVEVEDSEIRPGETITPDKTVLCIGGRGPLDEAAALLLMHLLQRAGVPARLTSKDEGNDSNVFQLDNTGAKTVCLCYLDPGNINRARYILRRLKRRNPDMVAIAAFWGFPHDGAEAAEAIGCVVVTKFDEAVEAIIAAVKAGAPQSEAA